MRYPKNMKQVEGKMLLLPPRPGVCQECAVDHKPEEPHNKDSMYYQMKFKMKNDRWPTWEDAMAHCSQDIKNAMIQFFESKNISWKISDTSNEVEK